MATKTHIVRTEEDQVEKAVQIRSDDPGSPVSNQTWINTTDKKMKFYDGSDIQNVGAAGVGSASTFALFQAEDGDISSFTNMAIESASPIAGDKSYSISSLPAAAPSISVDERRAGSTCVVSLMSKLTSGSGKIVVKDNSSNVLESVIVSGTSAEKVVIDFGIPAAATSIQISFEDESSATGWVVDDIEFSDNPFVYKNLVETSSVRAEGNGGESISTGTTDITWTEVSDTHGAWDGTTYTVKNDNSIVDIKLSAFFTTSTSRQIDMYVNGVRYKKIGFIDGADVELASYLSDKGEFSTGDAITFRSLLNGGTLSSDSKFHWLTINESWEAEHVVTPAKAAVEHFSCDAVETDFWDTTAATFNFNTSLVPLTDSQYIEYNDTTETRIVAKKSCIVHFTATGRQNDNVSLYARKGNGDYLSWQYAQANTEWNTISGTVELNVGEYFYFSRGTATSGSRAGGISLEVRPKEAEFLAAVPMNYTQTKYLSATQTSGGIISDLTFNNLVVGKVYRVDFQAAIIEGDNSNASHGRVEIVHNSDNIARVRIQVTSGGGNDARVTMSTSATFTAAASTLTFNYVDAGTAQVIGGAGGEATFATLTELNYTKETTRFS